MPIPVVDGQLHAEGDQPPCDVLPGPEVQRSEEVQRAGQVRRSGGGDSPKECLPGSGAHGEKVHAGPVEPVPSKSDVMMKKMVENQVMLFQLTLLLRYQNWGEMSQTLNYLKEKMGDLVKIRKNWGRS